MDRHIAIDNVLAKIERENGFHKKKIIRNFRNNPAEFFNEFESFIDEYSGFLKSIGLDIDYSIDAYLRMIKNMFKSQIKFMRTGRYPVESSDDAIENIL